MIPFISFFIYSEQIQPFHDFLFRLAGATFTYDERSASRSGPKAQTARGARTSPAAKADRLGREEPTAIAKKRV